MYIPINFPLIVIFYSDEFELIILALPFIIAGIFFVVIYNRYRSISAKHEYERETKIFLEDELIDLKKNYRGRRTTENKRISKDNSRSFRTRVNPWLEGYKSLRQAEDDLNEV